MRETARQFRVSLDTVQRWVQRAAGQRLDRVDWSDRSAAPHTLPARTEQAVEDLVLTVRRDLKETSDLGEWGAVAIQRELQARALPMVPSVRTINRILERRGALDARHRVRHKPPPRGWYLPDVAAGRAELDQFDAVEGLRIKDGPEVEVFTVTALHSSLINAWPGLAVSAASARTAMMEHWRAVGLPTYAQFDNDTRFQGPHQHPDVIGSVMRLCLSLEVVPVFAPPRESGFQAAIENLNGRWQAKVWTRFQHESLEALQAQSAKYVAASRARMAVRLEGAPARRPVPAEWKLDLQAHPQGRIVFLRRTSEAGAVVLLGHAFTVDRLWPHRLLRCEVDLDAAVIRFYRLRRREPGYQPLVATVPYVLPQRRFRE